VCAERRGKEAGKVHHLAPPSECATAPRELLRIETWAAPGVDGMRWKEYEKAGRRLTDLHSRIHRGAYRAQPSRRVYIPKADGRQRRWALRVWRDKIVHSGSDHPQQIYEVGLPGFSYGFRRAQSASGADALNVGITRRGELDSMRWSLPPVERFCPPDSQCPTDVAAVGLRYVHSP